MLSHYAGIESLPLAQVHSQMDCQRRCALHRRPSPLAIPVGYQDNAPPLAGVADPDQQQQLPQPCYYHPGMLPTTFPQPPRPPTPAGNPRPGPLAPRPNVPSPPPTP